MLSITQVSAVDHIYQSVRVERDKPYSHYEQSLPQSAPHTANDYENYAALVAQGQIGGDQSHYSGLPQAGQRDTYADSSLFINSDGLEHENALRVAEEQANQGSYQALV
jgi:hypothetical protein